MTHQTPTLPSLDAPNKPKRAKQKPQTTAAQHTPAAPASEGYIPRNVDVRLNRQQATILRDKLRALQDTGATTDDGRHVTNRAQAVRWILENEVQLA